jgi:hypothetical protein
VPGQFRLLPVTIKCEEAKRLDPKGACSVHHGACLLNTSVPAVYGVHV